jgi:hypothetical protein
MDFNELCFFTPSYLDNTIHNPSKASLNVKFTMEQILVGETI